MTIKEEMEDAMIKGLDDVADLLFQLSQEKIAKEHTDRGLLLGSGDILSPKKDVRVIIYRAPHAVPCEFGSKPHMPPVEPLKKWAKRKLGDESAGWAVAMKIKKEGTLPMNFLRSAIEKARLEAPKLFQARMQKLKNARM